MSVQEKTTHTCPFCQKRHKAEWNDLAEGQFWRYFNRILGNDLPCRRCAEKMVLGYTFAAIGDWDLIPGQRHVDLAPRAWENGNRKQSGFLTGYYVVLDRQTVETHCTESERKSLLDRRSLPILFVKEERVKELLSVEGVLYRFERPTIFRRKGMKASA